MPEEINRRIVDHTADINLPYSSIAREYLLREGLPPDRIIKTGSPMHEVIHHYLPKIEASTILTRLNLSPEQYFVVSCHREENVDTALLGKLVDVLNGVSETFGQRVIMSVHPRTRKRFEATGAKLHPLVEQMKPLGFPDYIQLQRYARAVLSDSGTMKRACSCADLLLLCWRQPSNVVLLPVSTSRPEPALVTPPAPFARTEEIVSAFALAAPPVTKKLLNIKTPPTKYTQ